MENKLFRLFFEVEFGYHPKEILREFVNSALDAGIWFKNFDIATIPGDLSDEDYISLINAIKSAFPNNFFPKEKIKRIFEKYLAQAWLSTPDFIFDDDVTVFLTDSLRVAKIKSGDLIWVTKRISWDGVKLIWMDNEYLYGEWYEPFGTGNWKPLILSKNNGALIKGMEIEY